MYLVQRRCIAFPKLIDTRKNSLPVQTVFCLFIFKERNTDSAGAGMRAYGAANEAYRQMIRFALIKLMAVRNILSQKAIGEAILLAARTRPKFIGGSRAVYDETLL